MITLNADLKVAFSSIPYFYFNLNKLNTNIFFWFGESENSKIAARFLLATFFGLDMVTSGGTYTIIHKEAPLQKTEPCFNTF